MSHPLNGHFPLTFSPEDILIALYGIIHFIISTVILSNFLFAPRIGIRKKVTTEMPLVSVLIPARNEEGTISRCINSILSQDYPNYTITVCDDNSTDNTAHEVLAFTRAHNHVFLITGKQLPSGWTGKNWACYQLSQQATAPLLLFVDADCFLAPDAISSAVALAQRNNLGLLSVFPTQMMVRFGERLVVPLMEWMLLSFLPLPLVFRSSWLSFTAANGQFMLFNREAYDTIGGHQTVKQHIVEDMALAKAIKKSGYRLMTALGNNAINCRMYSGYTSAINGFLKNFYPGFNMPPYVFIALLVLWLCLFLMPFFLQFFEPAFAFISIIVICQRFMLSLCSKQNPMINCILHPLQMIIMAKIGYSSVINSRRSTLNWKGRKL